MAGRVRSDSCALLGLGSLTVYNGETHVVTGLEIYVAICVEPGGTLELASGATLFVVSSITVAADGIFRFNAANGLLPSLISLGNLVISGTITSDGPAGGLITRTGLSTVMLKNGAIVAANGGYVEISAPITVSSGAEILAASEVVIISGPATIHGTARATDGADLVFTATPVAGSTGLIHVDSPDARLVFDVGSGQVFNGALDFYVETGELIFADSVTTAGGTRLESGGTIRVVAGETFQSTGTFTGP
jgi:hypothetical protein